jgi:hypothetical protein
MFSSYMNAINRVFAYLNKYFCMLNEKPTTNTMGTRKFHSIVLNNDIVQENVIKCVNQHVCLTHLSVRFIWQPFSFHLARDQLVSDGCAFLRSLVLSGTGCWVGFFPSCLRRFLCDRILVLSFPFSTHEFYDRTGLWSFRGAQACC